MPGAKGRHRGLFGRIVIEVRAEPSFHFYYAHAFAYVVINNLIALDLTQVKIA
jgi:hypothetical protein